MAQATSTEASARQLIMAVSLELIIVLGTCDGRSVRHRTAFVPQSGSTPRMGSKGTEEIRGGADEKPAGMRRPQKAALVRAF
jgi:hypothetical protein